MTPVTPEQDLANEVRNLRMQYAADQTRNREMLRRIERELFGDKETGYAGLKAEVKLATEFRVSVENGYTWVKRIGYGLVVLSGAIAAWWGALHKKP